MLYYLYLYDDSDWRCRNDLIASLTKELYRLNMSYRN